MPRACSAAFPALCRWADSADLNLVLLELIRVEHPFAVRREGRFPLIAALANKLRLIRSILAHRPQIGRSIPVADEDDLPRFGDCVTQASRGQPTADPQRPHNQDACSKIKAANARRSLLKTRPPLLTSGASQHPATANAGDSAITQSKLSVQKNTCDIPEDSRFGSTNVASSLIVSGSNTTISAKLPGSKRPLFVTFSLSVASDVIF